MTVLAYRDGVLASDSATFSGDILIGLDEKVWVIDGKLVGAAGCAPLTDRFVAWLKQGQVGPPPCLKQGDHHGEVFIINREGVCEWWYGDMGFTTLRAPHYAFGVGRDLALGAMASGADAVSAVEIAIHAHAYCGGPVQRVTA